MPDAPRTNPRDEGEGAGERGRPAPALLAVDTGGTFTDLLLLEGSRLRTLKVPSTPADPADAVLRGIEALLETADDARGPGSFVLLHGSTVATNTLLERTGARVALVTNRGFEDVLEIGRQDRPQLYALVGHRPEPLVGRDARLGVGGRLDADGHEVEPLEADELRALPSRVAATGADAVALCLLHSYADPRHEEAVADALAGAELPVFVSSRLLPEYREYERTATTVINAYVAPRMTDYLGRLGRAAGATRVLVMGSAGGTMPVSRAVSEPGRTVLSGPSGGVVAALEWGRRAGFPAVVSFDMGGTSTDVSLCPERPLHTRELEIAGTPLALPVLDIHTVGAGGGSIARVDAGGGLRVGPRSAGSDPGPVAYGRGGDRVTLTDAHVWLGRLPVDAFLGGDTLLDREAVEEPLRALADELGGGLDEAAEGVIAVADSAMERALRVISVERGYDPADFAVVAFGGAAGLHAAELAGRLGAGRVLVPPDPGVLSAYGMLAAPLTREVSRSVLLPADDEGHAAAVAQGLDELEIGALRTLERESSAGTAERSDVRVERWVDARYRGQSFELRVPADDWAEAFHRAHETRYGYARRDAVVEAVTLRAVATAAAPPLPSPRLPEADGPPPSVQSRVRSGGRDLDAARIRRSDLRARHRLEGPAIVEEYSATTWLPPGWTLDVDEWGVMHLRRGG